jgi:hypothetical protein
MFLHGVLFILFIHNSLHSYFLYLLNFIFVFAMKIVLFIFYTELFICVYVSPKL